MWHTLNVVQMRVFAHNTIDNFSKAFTFFVSAEMVTVTVALIVVLNVPACHRPMFANIIVVKGTGHILIDGVLVLVVQLRPRLGPLSTLNVQK